MREGTKEIITLVQRAIHVEHDKHCTGGTLIIRTSLNAYGSLVLTPFCDGCGICRITDSP